MSLLFGSFLLGAEVWALEADFFTSGFMVFLTESLSVFWQYKQIPLNCSRNICLILLEFSLNLSQVFLPEAGANRIPATAPAAAPITNPVNTINASSFFAMMI